jgi:ABC-2 type transport system ATP-binding protein
MVDGRLVALDTPAALKRRYVPARVLWVRGRNLALAAAGLRSRPGIIAVEPFGAGLHLQVAAHDWDPASVAAALASAGAQAVEVEASEPTLEDVFLAVVARPREAPAP